MNHRKNYLKKKLVSKNIEKRYYKQYTGTISRIKISEKMIRHYE